MPGRSRYSVLRSPGGAIAIRPEHICPAETTIRVKELDISLTNRTFLITRADGSMLMKISGKTLGRNLKREFTDSSGLPLFELRRNSHLKFDNAWSAALPGAQEGDDVLSASFKMFVVHTKFDIYMRNLALPSVDAQHARHYRDHVKLEVRGQDMSNLTSHVTCEGNKVIHIRRESDELDLGRNAYKHAYGHRTEWEVTVAEGVDLTLAGVVVIILAEMRG